MNKEFRKVGFGGLFDFMTNFERRKAKFPLKTNCALLGQNSIEIQFVSKKSKQRMIETFALRIVPVRKVSQGI